eukprot:1392513-Amorphochlora_amoeboformis.AAC.5
MQSAGRRNSLNIRIDSFLRYSSELIGVSVTKTVWSGADPTLSSSTKMYRMRYTIASHSTTRPLRTG